MDIFLFLSHKDGKKPESVGQGYHMEEVFKEPTLLNIFLSYCWFPHVTLSKAILHYNINNIVYTGIWIFFLNRTKDYLKSKKPSLCKSAVYPAPLRCPAKACLSPPVTQGPLKSGSALCCCAVYVNTQVSAGTRSWTPLPQVSGWILHLLTTGP